MAVAMVAMLAFGGTYAYFTASAGAAIESGEIQAGHVEIGLDDSVEITKEFTGTYAVPGDTLWDISISVDTSKTNVDIYVFASWTLTEDKDVTLSVTGNTWTQLKDGDKTVEGIYYQTVAAAETSVDFASKVDFATTNGTDAMDAKISCSVKFDAAQQGHLTAVEAAKELGLYTPAA